MPDPPDRPAPAGRPAGAARNTVFSFLTQISTAAFTAVLTIFLIRKLGPREFGIFSLAVSVGGLMFLPSDFGISGSTARFVAERRGDRSAVAALLADALRLKLAISGVLSAVLIAVAPLIASAYGEPSLTWPIRWVSVAVLGQSLVAFYRYAFVAQGEASRGFRIVVCESAVETGATIVLVLLAGGAAAAAAGRATGYAAGVGAAILVTLRALGRPAFTRGRTPGSTRRRLARYAGALFIIDAAFTVSVQSAPLLIGGFLGAKAVGLFQAPSRLIVLLQYPGVSIANGVAPRLARSEAHEPDVRTFTAALRYLIVFQALLVAPIAVWAEPIVHLVLGAGYDRSADLLRELTPYVFGSGLSALVAGGVNYLGGARRRVPVALLDLVLSLGLTTVLLQTNGLDGAAWASDVVPFLYVPLHVWIARKFIELPLRPLLRAGARGLLAAAAMAGVLLAFGTSHLSALDWIVGGGLGLTAFLSVLVLLGEVTFAELRALPALVGGRLGARRT